MTYQRIHKFHWVFRSFDVKVFSSPNLFRAGLEMEEENSGIVLGRVMCIVSFYIIVMRYMRTVVHFFLWWFLKLLRYVPKLCSLYFQCIWITRFYKIFSFEVTYSVRARFFFNRLLLTTVHTWERILKSCYLTLYESTICLFLYLRVVLIIALVF